MDQRDRQLIHRKMEKLIQHTQYEVLMDECLNRGMLSGVMKAIIEDRYPDEPTQHRKLFEKITKRGPTAYQTLLEICQKHFPVAFNLLKPGNTPTSFNSAHVHHNNARDEYTSIHNHKRVRSVSSNIGDATSNIQQTMRTTSLRDPKDDDAKNNNVLGETNDKEKKRIQLVEFKEIFQTPFKVQLASKTQSPPNMPIYPMVQRNRGVAVIINIINYKNDTHLKRNGAEIDKENLVSLFHQLGFTIFYYEDIGYEDLENLIVKLKASSYLSTECFVFYVLGHGNRINWRDVIYLHDNSVVYVENILKEFNNVQCPNLTHRPKLFFFSICRGDYPDLGTSKKTEHTERDGVMNQAQPAPTNMPTFHDMLICFSTIPGFAAHRDRRTGSWYVESMCKIWAKHAHDMDVERLMKLVSLDASENRTTPENAVQTPGTEQWGFNKLLFLNPGYYDQ